MRRRSGSASSLVRVRGEAVGAGAERGGFAARSGRMDGCPSGYRRTHAVSSSARARAELPRAIRLDCGVELEDGGMVSSLTTERGAGSQMDRRPRGLIPPAAVWASWNACPDARHRLRSYRVQCRSAVPYLPPGIDCGSTSVHLVVVAALNHGTFRPYWRHQAHLERHRPCARRAQRPVRAFRACSSVTPTMPRVVLGTGGAAIGRKLSLMSPTRISAAPRTARSPAMRSPST